jgi:hypothetical protein
MSKYRPAVITAFVVDAPGGAVGHRLIPGEAASSSMGSDVSS